MIVGPYIEWLQWEWTTLYSPWESCPLGLYTPTIYNCMQGARLGISKATYKISSCEFFHIAQMAADSIIHCHIVIARPRPPPPPNVPSNAVHAGEACFPTALPTEYVFSNFWKPSWWEIFISFIRGSWTYFDVLGIW